jgi:peptide deformylase
MAVIPLIPYDDPRLSQPCLPVDGPVDDLVQDLRDTVNAYPTGIGLAASQLGVLKQVFVLKIGTVPSVVINPVILWEGGQLETIKEGCLSFPGTGIEVARPVEIKVAYQDELGQPHDEELSGIKARCFLHETEHLRGTTILDHVKPGERETVLKALQRRLRRHL